MLLEGSAILVVGAHVQTVPPQPPCTDTSLDSPLGERGDTMNRFYLSPAFSTKRSPEELEFLREADGAAAFSMYWLDVTRPLLDHVGAKCLREIGADQGVHTRYLLQYCGDSNADLLVIEPVVGPGVVPGSVEFE